MPVDQETTLAISCDNPACPGNGLDPADRTGWTFVNTEVYGSPPMQYVYCCAECVGDNVGTRLAEDNPPPGVYESITQETG